MPGVTRTARDRLTLGEARTRLLEQQDVFAARDVIPVPCHPDCLAMGYALKLDGQVVPLSGRMDPQALLRAEHSTIVYERSDSVRQHLLQLFSTAASPNSAAGIIGQLLCCLPQMQLGSDLSYRNVFRVLFVKFMDAHDFDVRSVNGPVQRLPCAGARAVRARCRCFRSPCAPARSSAIRRGRSAARMPAAVGCRAALARPRTARARARSARSRPRST
jgi:hypothetical protein